MNEDRMIPEEEGVDLMEYVRKLWPLRKKLLKTAVIGAVVGVVFALGTSRKYTVTATVSPEMTKSASRTMFSQLSMLGLGSSVLNLSGDLEAINVMLYPEVVQSTPFMLNLFDSRVITNEKDAEEITLSDYLENRKGSLIGQIVSLPFKAIRALKSVFSDEENVEEETENAIDSFQLTREQAKKVKQLRTAIMADVDKKTGFTTISVTMDDPMVAAILADSVISKLKKSVTEYRTSKAQQDCDYLERLYNQCQEEYYRAQKEYASYVDANKAVVLQSVLIERERLQNDMNLAYQVYSQLALQLQSARAKVQEAKPVLAVVEPATVPLEPSGTSKMKIVLVFMFLAVVGHIVWNLYVKDLWTNFKQELKDKD